MINIRSRRSVGKILLVIAFLAPFLLGNESSCDNPNQMSTSGAQQVHGDNMYTVPKNSRGNTMEQQNILDRIRVTTDPTKIAWIHLIGLDGQIIKRMPVRSKITSSGKRLEPTHTVGDTIGHPESGIGDFDTDELIQPDGTFGSSDPYVYWFDPFGRYHQWGTAGGIGYLFTDYPIDLRNPMDEITGIYNASKAAQDWQKLQEENLKEQEKKNRVLTPIAPDPRTR